MQDHMKEIKVELTKNLEFLPKGLYDAQEFSCYDLVDEKLEQDMYNKFGLSAFVIQKGKKEIVGEAQLKISRGNEIVKATINLFVREEFRRSGVGTRLLEEVLFHSKKLSCNCIYAQVRSQNLLCKKLLERFGFQKTGFYPNGFDGESIICNEAYFKFLKPIKFD